MSIPIPPRDICILGAGPAGLAAALTLARNSIPFTLIDRDIFPRPKICGDGLSGKTINALYRIDPRLLTILESSGNAFPSWGATFISPGRKSVSILFSEERAGTPPGFVIRRQDLDHLLLQEVSGFPGAEIIQGMPVRQIAREDGGFVLSNPERGFRLDCRLLLFAAGYEAGLIRQLMPSAPAMTNEGLGIRAYFDGISGLDEDGLIEIHFLKELLPCYLWIFPLGDGKANVGLALPTETVRRKKMILKNLLTGLVENDPHLKKRFKHAIMDGKAEAHRLPFYQGRVPVSGDGFMLTGDAARLVDPFTGEGIGNAMLSGILAAETAGRAMGTEDLSAGSLMDYDKKLYDDLEKELALGLRLQDLAKNAMLLNLVIGRASRNKKVKDLLRDVLFGMNSMKDLGKPLFYAKLMFGLE